jgi:hypothetical protein
MLMTVRQDGELSRDTRKRFDTLYDRSAQLHQDDEKRPNDKLIKKCFEIANGLHPPDSLWMPADQAYSGHNGGAVSILTVKPTATVPDQC